MKNELFWSATNNSNFILPNKRKLLNFKFCPHGFFYIPWYDIGPHLTRTSKMKWATLITPHLWAYLFMESKQTIVHNWSLISIIFPINCEYVPLIKFFFWSKYVIEIHWQPHISVQTQDFKMDELHLGMTMTRLGVGYCNTIFVPTPHHCPVSVSVSVSVSIPISSPIPNLDISGNPLLLSFRKSASHTRLNSRFLIRTVSCFY